jgi:hypothetical protein
MSVASFKRPVRDRTNNSCWFDDVRDAEFEWSGTNCIARFKGNFNDGTKVIAWEGEAATLSYISWMGYIKSQQKLANGDVMVAIPIDLHQKIFHHLTD